jgi:hypothetical protein
MGVKRAPEGPGGVIIYPLHTTSWMDWKSFLKPTKGKVVGALLILGVYLTLWRVVVPGICNTHYATAAECLAKSILFYLTVALNPFIELNRLWLPNLIYSGPGLVPNMFFARLGTVIDITGGAMYAYLIACTVVWYRR